MSGGLGSLRWEHTVWQKMTFRKNSHSWVIHGWGWAALPVSPGIWASLKLYVQSLLSSAMEGRRLPVATSWHLELCREAVISVKSMALSFCTWGSGRSRPPRRQWLDGARNRPLAELDKMCPPPLWSCSKSRLARPSEWILATIAEL